MALYFAAAKKLRCFEGMVEVGDRRGSGRVRTNEPRSGGKTESRPRGYGIKGIIGRGRCGSRTNEANTRFNSGGFPAVLP
jgi:hypothetical protein